LKFVKFAGLADKEEEAVRVEITILVENTTPALDLVGEYGFSVLVRVDGHPILFDTGSRDALIKNAPVLGVDLGAVEDVVISHGHSDHTGGLRLLVENSTERRFYAHPHAFSHRGVVLPKGKTRDISMPVSREEITASGGTIIATPAAREIISGVLVTGEVPRQTGFEDTGGNFIYRHGEGWETDYILDDQSLVIDHPAGLIVVSGCAHAGLINTLEHARELTGRGNIHAFIGGTHLMTAGEERMTQTIHALKEYNIDRLVVCHCTGFYPAAILYRELGGIVQKGESGFRMTI